jgi:hypothetical protein
MCFSIIDLAVNIKMEFKVDQSSHRKGSPVKAISLALLIDVIGTSIVTVGCIVLYMSQLKSSGFNESQLVEAISDIDLMSPLFASGLFLGGLVSCYSGYFCAKVSKIYEYRNVAILSLIVTVLGFFAGGDLIQTIILTVINTLVYFSGAYLWIRKNTA